jgi:succinate dehydrogenase/fumarate reductase cytochrome b subunit
MNLLWATLVIAAVTALAVTAMLVVRRRAPEGSRFADGDRASGVFGVLATGFSVLLGFVVFLAFESYDQSRAGAESEALVLAQQVETAQFFPGEAAVKLTGELVCYGRSVIHVEWPRAEAGSEADEINPWGVALFRTLQTVDPRTPSEEAAYGKWLEQTSDREAARIDRLHGAVGVIPAPLWIVLVFISVVIFVYMLFFADRGEGAVTQAVLMGSIASVVVAMLLLISFLDSPFHEGIGGVRPVAMERTLRIMDEQLRIVNRSAELPCDAMGSAVG